MQNKKFFIPGLYQKPGFNKYTRNNNKKIYTYSKIVSVYAVVRKWYHVELPNFI